MENYIVTFTPYFKKNVETEIKKVDSHAKIDNLFDESHALISSYLTQKQFFSNLSKQQIIFIKHICPANLSGKIVGDLDTDRTNILNKIIQEKYSVNQDEKFAIQTRIVKGGDKNKTLQYSSKDIEVFVGTYFTEKGGIPTFSDRKITNQENVKIFSVFINGYDFYLGNSNSSQNLNFACDEYKVSSKAGGRIISRAENKLIEALSKYKIDLGQNGGIALDIGAAPGGWTKVLVDHGFNVVSVDPGNLHPDLQNNPKVNHVKAKIEDLEFENYFDIIVNDMNVEPSTTAKIMNSLSHCLKKNGIAIVTLKLPSNPNKFLKEGCDILEEKFKIVSINSLFHNRQEVTALIQKNEDLQ